MITALIILGSIALVAALTYFGIWVLMVRAITKC